MVVDQWQTVKLFADAMSRELLRYRISISIRNLLNRLANMVQWHARLADRDRFVQGLLRPLHQLLASLVHIAYQECCRCVSMIPIQVDLCMIDRKTQMSDTWATKQITPDEICRAYRDVDVDDITVL